jgi:hypothetical protein
MHDFQLDTHWLHVWQHQIARTVVLAVRRLRPARVVWGTRPLHLAQNRRVLCADGKVYRNWLRPKPAPVLRDGPLDPAVTVLWVQAEDGRPLAVLASYTMHPVTAMGLPSYSADFPGIAVRLVEMAIGGPESGHAHEGSRDGFVALSTNGAAVNVNPPEVRRSFADTEQVGQAVGDVIVQAASQLRAEAKPPCDATRLASASALLHPASRPALPLAEAKARSKEARRTGGPRAASRDLRQYQRSAVAAEDDPLEVQLLRVGGLALVGGPGELFDRLGLAIKAASPAPLPAIVGSADDWQGYFPTPGAYDEGGYEVEPGAHSRYTAGAGQQIQQTALQLLHELFD